MTQALHTLLDHAERQRDAAMARLLQAEETARRLHLQAEQLQAYRHEYRQRHPAQGGRTASIEVLRCHQGFMQRLDQALAQQQGQLETADACCSTLRVELLALQTRVASVRKLMERRGHEAQRRADRHEQNRSDEAAARRRNDHALARAWNAVTDSVPLAQ
jgi:flagellar FliJ protein